MKLKINSKTFSIVFQTLLDCISDSLQYQVEPLVWSGEEKRLEHYHLDQFQCLLEAFYSTKKTFPTAYEVISDFSLLQNILDQTKLPFEKRKEFLAWYLRCHQRFFLQDDNCLIFEQIQFVDLYRQVFCSKTKAKEVSYSSLFHQYQQEVKIVQAFYRNPCSDLRKEAVKIYEKWGIMQEYIEALLYFNKECREEKIQLSPISCLSKEPLSKKNECSFSAEQHKNKKVKLHEYLELVKQGQWVQKDNLLEVRNLLLLFYSTEEASCLYKGFVARNQENHFRDIRVSSWGLEEEQFYQELLPLLYSNQEEMNPFYRKAILKSITDICDITAEMSALSSSLPDYLEYQKMLQDEIQMIHENYSYVYQGVSKSLLNSN